MGYKEYKALTSSIARSQVMSLLKLVENPQDVRIRISEDIHLGFEPEKAIELALIHVDEKGIVVSLDEDYIEGDIYGDGSEPDHHAYRPMFIPWCHVYGLWAYRAT